jgi:hypothetical protein
MKRRRAGNNGAGNHVRTPSLLNTTSQGQGVSVTVTDWGKPVLRQPIVGEALTE